MQVLAKSRLEKDDIAHLDFIQGVRDVALEKLRARKGYKTISHNFSCFYEHGL